MGKKVKVVNHPPVGGEDFIKALVVTAIEGDWMNVLYFAITPLTKKYETNDWHLSAEETGRLRMVVECLYGNYSLSIERQN